MNELDKEIDEMFKENKLDLDTLESILEELEYRVDTNKDNIVSKLEETEASNLLESINTVLGFVYELNKKDISSWTIEGDLYNRYYKNNKEVKEVKEVKATSKVVAVEPYSEEPDSYDIDEDDLPF